MIDQRYFARKPFEHDTFAAMVSGFDPFRSLFGPRRIGKSWFLLYGLMPKAAEYGHRVAYVDFWNRGPAPLALLLYELDQALQKKSGLNAALSAARDLSPRVKLTALKGMGEIEIDLTKKPKSLPEDQVLLLDHYFAAFANGSKRAVLLLDEFQEIQATPDSKTLMAALRAAFNRHGAGLSAVFTGSSESRLKKVFSSKSAPFYRFATPLRLPPLGEEFVEHQLGLYPAPAIGITRDEAMTAFDAFDGNPDYFQRWLRLRPTLPKSTAQDVITEVSNEVAEELEFEQTWLNLNDTDRLLLRLISEGVTEIYGDAGRNAAEALGVTSIPDSSKLQTAMKKLERRDLADSWDGDRQIADPLFRSWILDRPKSDFAV